MDESVIVTTDLRKNFRSKRGQVEAVRGVSITVPRGEIFGFLGPNGAGKTTTLRMLTTLLPIDGGTALVAGHDAAREPQRVRERIGYVSQLGGADQQSTGWENLLLQGRLYGQDRRGVAARATELIEVLDLSNFAHRLVGTYSGGQRRRLDVAMGIIHQPEVLFLDEPSTGLDPQNRANLWEHIDGLRQTGSTVFLTTHYLDEADALCDRLVIIDHGRIVTEGTPADLKREVVGDAVLLTVSDEADALRASALLEDEDFVREIGASGEVVRLYVADGSAALPAILRAMDAAHVAVRSIALSEPTLDDVFLARTGRSLRDGDGPGRQEEM